MKANKKTKIMIVYKYNKQKKKVYRKWTHNV